MTQERLKEISEIVLGQEYIPHNEKEVTDDLLLEQALCKDRIDYLTADLEHYKEEWEQLYLTKQFFENRIDNTTADLEFYKAQLKQVNELLEELEND